MRIKCLAWTRYDRRPDLLAQHLGTSAKFIAHGRSGRLLNAPARYVSQTNETWQFLTRERPDVVFVQTPPIFAPILVMLYARRYGARYVVDAHTGAFLSPKWQWSLPLLRGVTRGALTTLVTNEHLKRQLEGWGARANILAFTPGQYPPGEPYAFEPGEAMHVVVVSTFEIDEPLDVVFDAARQLPDVGFYVTGNPARAPAQLVAHRPANCHLTGFLPYARYVGLMRGSDAMLDLTTVDHTLLMGAYEAVSLGTPLIISDWPILRSYFGKAAVCVPNTAQGVLDGVAEVRRSGVQLRERVARLSDDLHAEWNRDFGALKLLLEQQVKGPVARSTAQAAGSL